MKSLQETIDWTLRYFAFFSRPLSVFEVWKWQRGTTYSYTEIRSGLKNVSKQGIFYSTFRVGNPEGCQPSGLKEMVDDRHRRYRDAIAKYRRIDWYVWYLARLPWVEGVAFCNNLPFHHTEARSDIDLFLLVRPGMLWKTRLFALLPLKLLRMRPGEAAQHPIDVSFLVSTDAMNLSNLQIEKDDPYLAIWVSALSPVFERREGVFTDFWAANQWATTQFPQAKPGKRASFWRHHARWSFPCIFPERLAKQLQQAFLPQALTTPEAEASIVMNDAMLKFHQNDRRKEIRDWVCEY